MKVFRMCSIYLIILGVSIVCLSCAATTQGVLHSDNSYDTVFTACLQAAPEADFSIASQDRAAGFIVAEQGVLGGHGSVVRMNITVMQTAAGTEVDIAIVPPPGTVGDIETMFNRYVQAVQRRVPDVVIISQ